MPLTQVDQGLLGQFAQYTGFKNRIINGAMMIDQRNAGASVTPTNGQYTVDRFAFLVGQPSKLTAQQSSAGLTGFTKCLRVTSSSAYSILSSDQFVMYQPIEGYNAADLAWGTASAATVTLSFWARSSLTGTFGGALQNSLNNRSYPFTYTINAANTWEQKSVTIAGDTSGTWATDNGIGLYLFLSLGVGSTYSGTAGAWAGGNYKSATSAQSLVGTSGATLDVTGVQLEKGSTATAYDYRPYGTELALCQRYFETSYDAGTVPGTGSILGSGAMTNVTTTLAGSTAGNAVGGGQLLPFKVTKRTNPTIVTYDYDGTANAVRVYPADAKKTGVTSVANIRMDGGYQFMSFNNSSATAISSGNNILFGWTASAEL